MAQIFFFLKRLHENNIIQMLICGKYLPWDKNLKIHLKYLKKIFLDLLLSLWEVQLLI